MCVCVMVLHVFCDECIVCTVLTVQGLFTVTLLLQLLPQMKAAL